jgi:four helix bundle protein
MNYIAEGFERKENKECNCFLNAAKGSCGEVHSILNLVKELDKISEEVYKTLTSLAEKSF